MATETHLYTPDEIGKHIEQAENRIGKNDDIACVFAQIASAKAMAEIAYQLERLHTLIAVPIDQHSFCVVTRKCEW